MGGADSVTSRAHAALGRLGFDLHRYPVRLEYLDGVLTMEGELPDIAAKKRALERGAALPEVRWVADRLRVEPSVDMMSDVEVLDHIRDVLLSEPTFDECTVRVRGGGTLDVLREPPRPRGALEVAVDEGIVRLEGAVPSLSHKRLAGVLCWWAPGTRDVMNALEVDALEEDNDDEISDAVRIVLEKDPLLDASEIGVSTERSRVTLRGLVASEEQRRITENDAWYVFGVNDVSNEIEVSPDVASARWRRVAAS
ncbi:BON domain-containing protein [Sorangium sp. So ce296]|uniref:BON domain-containing protein n=1 Tax=Sorangium sp. So ce296 TaxID=3133296 RepID=UPI003F62A595